MLLRSSQKPKRMFYKIFNNSKPTDKEERKRAEDVFDVRVLRTNMPRTPFSFTTSDGQTICFLLEHEHKPCVREIYEDVSKFTHHLGCIECYRRLCKYCKCSSIEGDFMPSGEKMSIEDPAEDDESDGEGEGEIEELKFSYSASKNPIIGIKVISKETIDPVEVGGFEHYTLIPTKVSEITQSAEFYEKGVKRYLGIMEGIYENTTKPSVISILEQIIKNLADIPYGEKIIDSVRWYQRHATPDFMDLPEKEKKIRCINAILDSCLQEDIGEQTVSIYIQQFKNNVLELTEASRTLEEFKALVRSRFSPSKYLRRTAEPTVNQMEIARRELSEYSTSLMTWREALDHYGLHIFEKPRSLETPKSLEKEGMSLGYFTRMKQLYELPPDTSIEIYSTEKHSPTCAYTYEGLEGKVQEPLLRLYFNSRKSSSDKRKFGIPTDLYVQVDGILPLTSSKSHFLFITKGSYITEEINMSCCLPAFLTPRYMRTCGKYFEKHSKKPLIPDGRLCVGIGMNKAYDDGRLYSPIKVRVNGVEHTITHI
jgi:hypothetical protein